MGMSSVGLGNKFVWCRKYKNVLVRTCWLKLKSISGGECALRTKEVTFGIFLDIEDSFDDTPLISITRVTESRVIDPVCVSGF